MLKLDNVDLIPQIPNWNSTSGAIGYYDAPVQYGSFTVPGGGNFNLQINSDIHPSQLHLPIPNSGGFGFDVDYNRGLFKGFIEFSTSPFYIIDEDQLPQQADLLFSLDIGSDAAWGDLQQDGNEHFDPGDLHYAQINGVGVVNTSMDDTTIFSSAPIGISPTLDPEPSHPGALLPYHNLPFIDAAGPIFFDLDGSDYLDFSISTQINNWPSPGIDISNNLASGENFLICFDDDDEWNWSDGPASLPIESSSPAGHTYGPGNTEIHFVEIDPHFPGIPPQVHGLLSESQLHPFLSPDPQPITFDDDSDALDFVKLDPYGQTLTDHFYFTVDREATYFDQINGANLDPGVIYELVSPGNINAVIHPADLGVSSGVDLDAIEFGLYGSDDAISGMFTLFFSVDDDDPQTPEDES